MRTLETNREGYLYVAPSRLVRQIDVGAAVDDLDVTFDPEDGKKLGPATGIFAAGGGDVELLMVGSATSSVLTLPALGSLSVGFTRIIKAGTSATIVQVSW